MFFCVIVFIPAWSLLFAEHVALSPSSNCNDTIDESEELESVIQEAKDIMRLKRPMVKFDIRLEKIMGTHITPLTQVSPL